MSFCINVAHMAYSVPYVISFSGIFLGKHENFINANDNDKISRMSPVRRYIFTLTSIGSEGFLNS